MTMNVSVLSVGVDAKSRVIQVATTNNQETSPTYKYNEGGWPMVGFVDGGVNAPSKTQGLPVGAEAGTPYFISTVPGFYNGKNYTEAGYKNCNDFSDEPSAMNGLTDKRTGKSVSIVNFQTIIVAQNFYGSGQNVIMGVYNWGFKNGVQTHRNGIPPTTNITNRSTDIIKNDYPTYNLVQ